MNAMLALAASHHSALIGDKPQEDALALRIYAMRALNSVLSKPATSRMERDARMATAISLSFQATHIRGWDAYSEFLTMVRGCFLIGVDDGFEDPNSAFHAFRSESHIKVMRDRLTTATISPCNPDVLDAGIASLEALKPFCITEFEKWYCQSMVSVLDFAHDYPCKGISNLALSLCLDRGKIFRTRC